MNRSRIAALLGLAGLVAVAAAPHRLAAYVGGPGEMSPVPVPAPVEWDINPPPRMGGLKVTPTPTSSGLSSAEQLATITPTETGELTPKPVPANDAERQALIAEMRTSRAKGLLRSDIPETLTAFAKARVKVTLTRGEAAAKILAEEAGSLKPRNDQQIPVVRDFISVQLDGGDSFDVDAIMPDRPQDLTERDTGEWEFWVTPTAMDGGKHDIEIRVEFFDDLGYVPVDSFRIPVSVSVPFLSRLSSMIEGWPLELMLLIVGGAISLWLYDRAREWKLPRLRRQPAAATAAPEIERPGPMG